MATFVRVWLAVLIGFLPAQRAIALRGVWTLAIREVLIVDVVNRRVDLAHDYDPVGAKVDWMFFLNDHQLVFCDIGGVKHASYSLESSPNCEQLLSVLPAQGRKFAYSLRQISRREYAFCRPDAFVQYGSVDSNHFVACVGVMTQIYGDVLNLDDASIGGRCSRTSLTNWMEPVAHARTVLIARRAPCATLPSPRRLPACRSLSGRRI